MQTLLIDLLAGGFALGVIIVVHEAGHLLMAKAFGVRVLAFSIGFGKRLVGVQRGDTDYRISAIPLGGYVRLDGESQEEATDDPRQFQNKPRWQRVLVFLAGPATNVALSIGIFAVLFMIGIQVPNLPSLPPVIGAVEPGSSAAKVGLLPADLILTINGEPAHSWEEVGLALFTAPDKPVSLSVRRGERTFNAVVVPKRVPRYDFGDQAGLFPMLRPEIMEVTPGSPAAAAGIRPGDEIRAVEGRPITKTPDFIDAIEKHAGQRLGIELARQGQTMVIYVVPRLDGKVGRIGVMLGFFQRYAPGRALRESINLNLQIVSETFQLLGKIFRREMSAKGALSGPIEIVDKTGDAARSGIKYLFYIMGFISLSIAILNLMPIPILDGGQVLILLIEEVIRRDLPIRVKEIIGQVGLVLILMLMAIAIWFDLSKHLPAGMIPGS